MRWGLTGPVKVLFDFVVQVPVSCGSIACAVVSATLLRSAAPKGSNIASSVIRGDFKRLQAI